MESTLSGPMPEPPCAGVCAMTKKANSAPMTEMLNRLRHFTWADGLNEFTTIHFDQELILERPVEEWPVCEGVRLRAPPARWPGEGVATPDRHGRLAGSHPMRLCPFAALIAFFSDGFPLRKAQDYARLHPHMLVFNDLLKQEVLFDRREVYRYLEAAAVPVPTYTVYNPEDHPHVDESEDYLEINGVRRR